MKQVSDILHNLNEIKERERQRKKQGVQDLFVIRGDTLRPGFYITDIAMRRMITQDLIILEYQKKKYVLSIQELE